MPQGPPTPSGYVTVQDYIRAQAQEVGIPPEIALAVAEQESNFGRNPGPHPVTKAAGVFQFIPDTAHQRGMKDPMDPQENIQHGVRYLRELLDRHNLDLEGALKEYGGVKTNTTYVPEVLARIPKFSQNAPSSPPAPLPKAYGSREAVGEPSPPPAPRSFVQGLRETTLPSWEDLKTIGGAVVAKPGELSVFGLSPTGIAGTVGSIVRGAGQQSLEQLQKARTAWQDETAPAGSPYRMAKKVEAGARVGAAAIPILGPMAAKAGEAFGSGETAYGAGQAAGIVGPLLTGAALRGVRPTKATGGIPLTRGERTGSNLSRFGETLVEKTVPGRGPFQAFRAKQQEAVVNAANQAVENVSLVAGTPGESYKIGQRALDAVEEARESFKAPIKERYGQIAKAVETRTARVPVVEQVPSEAGLVDEFGKPLSVAKRTMQKVEVGGVQPETRGLKQFAIPLLRRVQKEAELLPPDQLKPVLDSLTRVVNAPKRLGYQAFQDARSDLLAIARRHGDPIPGKAGGLAKKLAELTDDAMEQAAVNSGITIEGTDLQSYVRQTNKLWAEAEETFNDGLFKRMVEQAPERVYLLLDTATLDDIARLKRHLPMRQRQELKAQLLDSWLRSDVQGEAMVPGVQGLPAASAGVSMRGSALRQKIERFGKDRLTALYTQQEAQEILSIAKVAEQLSKAKGEAAAGLIAGNINAAFYTAGPVALAAAAFGHGATAAGTLGGAGASALGLRIAAKLMTRPEGLTGIRRYLNALGTTRTAEAVAAAEQLSQIYQRIEAEEQGGPPMPRLMPSHDQGPPPPRVRQP